MIHGRIPLRYEWFHNIEGYKTKFNWFLLESAIEHYDRIMGNESLSAYRKQNTKEQIALFCAYYARRMKVSLLNNLRGKRKSIVIHPEYIEDYYPNHDRAMNITLLNMANEAWAQKLETCVNCPQQCLIDYAGKKIDFDIYDGQ